MKLLTLVLAAAVGAQAQSIAPPTCAHGSPARSHPSASDLLKMQEKFASDATVLLSPEPVGNMTLLRYQVRDYADCTGNSGCYWSDLDAQTRRADAVLESAVKSAPRAAKLAIVLDIDETSLSSYCEEIREDFGYIPAMNDPWIVSAEAAVPVPGTVRLAAHAQALGVSVFFITGRPERQREATAQNLKLAGYSDWKHLSLRQTADVGVATGMFKAAERQKIVDAGYRIVLNMGDQWSDLDGAPMAEHSIKLPNPFYYLP